MTIFASMTRMGYARLNNSQTATGLMLAVLGREVDADMYMVASTTMLVMFTVMIRSYLESPLM